MSITTSITAPSAFATAVREALSDLPPDELDELTDGLEADLAERAAESDTDLGDPAAYAEELRAAAGYPPRSAKSHLGDALPNLRTLPQELRRRAEAHLANHAWLRAIVDFFVALRPVWWVLRGLAVYAVVVTYVGGSQFAATWWWAAVAAVVLSVQVGRGRMLGRAWARWAMRIGSAVAIIALPFLAGWAATQVNLALSESYSGDVETYFPQGLTGNGSQVDNIFAYGADGEPIDQVQLFDQNGQPLNITSDTTTQWWDAQDGSMIVPSGDVPGRAGWNVYPLAHVKDWSDFEDDGSIDATEVAPTEFPFGTAKPLAGSGQATGATAAAPSTGCAPTC